MVRVAVVCVVACLGALAPTVDARPGQKEHVSVPRVLPRHYIDLSHSLHITSKSDTHAHLHLIVGQSMNETPHGACTDAYY